MSSFHLLASPLTPRCSFSFQTNYSFSLSARWSQAATATGLDAAYAVHDSSLLDMRSSLACLMPAALSLCLMLAGAACTQLLAAQRGEAGEGCIAQSLVAVLLPRARSLSGARCNGLPKHTAIGLKQRILPCLQLSPLVEQRTTFLAQGRGAGKYDSLECGMPARYGQYWLQECCPQGTHNNKEGRSRLRLGRRYLVHVCAGVGGRLHSPAAAPC